MPPKTAKITQYAGIVTNFRKGKKSLPAGKNQTEALHAHKAAEASLEGLGKTLAELCGRNPVSMQESMNLAATLVRIRLENRQAVASCMTDAHVVLEMSEFVRRQILSQHSNAGSTRMKRLSMHLACCES